MRLQKEMDSVDTSDPGVAQVAMWSCAFVLSHLANMAGLGSY